MAKFNDGDGVHDRDHDDYDVHDDGDDDLFLEHSQ
jgi:hypothetical protein